MNNIINFLLCNKCSPRTQLHKINDVYVCKKCKNSIKIINRIPRFVSNKNNYAKNFGYEWRRWGKLQLDSKYNHNISEDRFFRDSGWTREWLKGKYILDAGCGAGRFTEIAAKYGAYVFAVDMSEAVDAALINTRENAENIYIIQGSLYDLPFPDNFFDAIYCFGVIQHTPYPLEIVKILPKYLKDDGKLAYNYYEKTMVTLLQPIKYLLRLITPYLGNRVNFYLSLLLTCTFFPISYVLSKFRLIRFFCTMLPICSSHQRGLTISEQFRWTLLDTFDWYTPMYEYRQSSTIIKKILEFEGIEILRSSNGVTAGIKRNTKP